MNGLIRNARLRVLIALIAVGILTTILRALHHGPAAAPDFMVGQAGSAVVITIADGETGSQLAEKLFQQGVVKSALAYFRIAVGDPRSATVAPGDHLIETRIPAKEALSQLLDKDRIQGLINVADGARLAEVVTEMIDAGFNKTDVSQALIKVKLPLATKNTSPEGFLYPAHYSFARGTTAEQALRKMISTFTLQTSSIDFTKIIEGYSGYQLVIIGSLIQAEADPQDYARVARVIYNRLAINMPLQLDTTVQYLLHRRGEITLALKDTKIRSAYNTYQRYGLPPGPIGSPTLAALEAALNPAVGDWLYFITVAPGDTRFTKSHTEFLGWKREYQQNVKAGLFKVKQ